MLNCRQATRLVSQSMDRRLRWYQRLGVRVHLLYCVWCRRYARQLQVLREGARHLPQENLGRPAETLSGQAKEEMCRRLEQAMKDAPPPAV